MHLGEWGGDEKSRETFEGEGGRGQAGLRIKGQVVAGSIRMRLGTWERVGFKTQKRNGARRAQK